MRARNLCGARQFYARLNTYRKEYGNMNLLKFFNSALLLGLQLLLYWQYPHSLERSVIKSQVSRTNLLSTAKKIDALSAQASESSQRIGWLSKGWRVSQYITTSSLD